MDNSVYVLPNAAVGGFEKTVLVFGCGRGGTSMVAGALRELGVNMGEHLHPLKHESNFFEPGMTPQEVNAKIAHYNGRYPVWGWKCPGDIFSISKFAHQLRNPHFVVVMRSMYGILMSNYRHLGISPELAIGDVGTVFDEIGRFVTNCPYPVAMVGYEAAVQQPATFIDGVAGFLGLTDISEGTRANATAFVSGSRKYKAVAAENATQAHQEERMAVDNIYDGVVNKISILSARVRGFSFSHESLMKDSAAAEDIVRELTGRLNHLQAEAKERNVVLLQADQPYISKREAVSIEEADRAKDEFVRFYMPEVDDLEAHYMAAREAYIHAARWRARQQNKMDELSERIRLLEQALAG